MTLAPLPTTLPRCSVHGLLLDDRACCARRDHQHIETEGARALRFFVGFAAVVVALVIVAGGALTGYRHVAAHRARSPPGPRPRLPATASSSCTRRNEDLSGMPDGEDVHGRTRHRVRGA